MGQPSIHQKLTERFQDVLDDILSDVGDESLLDCRNVIAVGKEGDRKFQVYLTLTFDEDDFLKNEQEAVKL